MKKILTIILTILLLNILLVGCSGEETTNNEVGLNEVVTLGDYEVTVTKFELVKDSEGRSVIKLYYDWTNNSKKTQAPYITVNFKAFQNDVKIAESLFSEDIDLGLGQKEASPGTTLTGLEDGFLLNDTQNIVEIEIKELMSFNSEPYILKVNPSEL
ncbi:DUF5067 domain-containing protein [Tissierella creatinini]|nr:DUF5067 domain-containing protein [Tissierella creatinini]TJX66525.1 DUF5067 domain-containing protein [Soehngenia saccharolytica]